MLIRIKILEMAEEKWKNSVVDGNIFFFHRDKRCHLKFLDVSVFFQLTQYLQDLAMLWHVSKYPSFIRLVFHCISAIFCLSICPLMDTGVFPLFGSCAPLSIGIQVSLFLLGPYLGVELLTIHNHFSTPVY